MEFTLTFNKPAYKMFFEGEEATGLKIRVQDGIVQFRPVDSDEEDGSDTASLSMRERGGVAAVIEGTASDTIFSHLKNPHGLPYFLLSRAPKGWITATPFEGPGREPPRFAPQVRVWTKSTARPLPLHLIHDMKGMEVANFVQELREAKSIIDDHSKKKKIGRPPADVTAARDKIKLFADVARDILPVNGLWRAYLMLGRYLGANPQVPPQINSAGGLTAEDMNPFGHDEEADDSDFLDLAPAPVNRGRKRKGEDDEVTVVSRKPQPDAEAERLASEAQAKLGLKDDAEKSYSPPKQRGKAAAKPAPAPVQQGKRRRA